MFCDRTPADHKVLFISVFTANGFPGELLAPQENKATGLEKEGVDHAGAAA